MEVGDWSIFWGLCPFAVVLSAFIHKKTQEVKNMNWTDNKTKKKRKVTTLLKYAKYLSIIIILISIGIVIGTLLITDNNKKTEQNQGKSYVYIETANLQKEPFYINQPRSKILHLPAIRINKTQANNSGIPAYIEITISPGNGSILMTLNNILSRHDTQDSIRTAYEVASMLTNKSTDSVDITYNLLADASMLQGPSAGAAFTILTMAVLEDKNVRQDVRITGSINHDGTIGPAGMIKEKAISSANDGASIMIVPMGSAIEYIEKEYCADYGIFKDYCQTEYIPVYLSESIKGIDIIEVQTIREAAAYFYE